jgi:hypothetical protein
MYDSQGRLIITNSIRGTYLDCPYKYFLEYVRRLSPTREPIFFTWGSYVHRAFELLGEFHDLNTTLEIVDEEHPGRESWTHILRSLLLSYIDYWSNNDTKYEYVQTETTFAIPIPEANAVFKGKLDGLLRDISTGEYVLREFKTPSHVGPQYLARLPLDSQPRGYLLAVQRTTGFPVLKCRYELLKKPGGNKGLEKPEETASEYIVHPKKYFIRHSLEYEQHEIDNYYWELVNLAKQIRWCINEGIYMQHHPAHRTGGCVYMPICLKGICPENSDLFTVRPADEINPELIN